MGRIFNKPVIFFSLLVGIIWGQSVDVPLSHWVYDYITGLEVRHVLPAGRNTRPWSREYIAKRLALLQEDAVKARLSAADRERLAFLETEFKEEMARSSGRADTTDVWNLFDRHLLQTRWRGSYLAADYAFQLTENAYGQGVYGDPVNTFRKGSGGTFWGYLGKRTGFYFYGEDIYQAQDRTDAEPDLLVWDVERNAGYSQLLDERFRYFDWTNAYLTWQGRYVRFLFGRNQTVWGPGRHSGLTFSRQGLELDQASLEVEFGRFRFYGFHGKAFENMVDSTRSIRDTAGVIIKEVYRPKYIAAHRLEVALPRRITLGLNEMLVYGDRELEFAYLNPLMFYWSAEHSLNDQDNVLLSADISVNTLRGLTVYGEFLLDDFTGDSLSTGWFGNKWAFLSGCHIAGLPPGGTSELILEYARIEPWVYSHVHYISAFSNQGRPLGYWLGPHADHFSCELRTSPLAAVGGRLLLSYERRGENITVAGTDSVIDVGGDILDPHETGDAVGKGFLSSGVKETRFTVGAEITVHAWHPVFKKGLWQMLQDLTLTTGIYYIRRGNVSDPASPADRTDTSGFRYSAGLSYHFN